MSLLGYEVTTALGRVAAAELDNIFIPRSPRAGRCGVVLVHGSGAPQQFVDPVAQPASARIAAALAGAGIPCIAGAFGGQTWGNDTSLSRISAAWALLKTKVPTMRTDKLAVLGVSMGGVAAARFTQNNPTLVAAFVGLIPLLDLKSFYAANAGAVANEISGAWGIANGAALPTNGDIMASVAKHKAPSLVGYSTVDATVLPAWINAYCTALGSIVTKIVTDTTFGHSDAAVAGMPIATLGKFLANNGC